MKDVALQMNTGENASYSSRNVWREKNSAFPLCAPGERVKEQWAFRDFDLLDRTVGGWVRKVPENSFVWASKILADFLFSVGTFDTISTSAIKLAVMKQIGKKKKSRARSKNGPNIFFLHILYVSHVFT